MDLAFVIPSGNHLSAGIYRLPCLLQVLCLEGLCHAFCFPQVSAQSDLLRNDSAARPTSSPPPSTFLDLFSSQNSYLWKICLLLYLLLLTHFSSNTQAQEHCWSCSLMPLKQGLVYRKEETHLLTEQKTTSRGDSAGQWGGRILGCEDVALAAVWPAGDCIRTSWESLNGPNVLGVG